MSKSLNFIDLFSGAGGMSCGLEMAGLNCLLGVDFDKKAIETFKKNHKKAQSYCGDINKLTNEMVDKFLGGETVHAVVGGPPCQGFSTVGRGNPDDKRNSLFLQFVRIVKHTKPLFVVIENVTGLVARKNEDTLHSIFDCFAELGYKLDFKVVEAQQYGVPERRKRTIIVGSRVNNDIILPIPTHENNYKTVGEALRNLKATDTIIYNHEVDKAKVVSERDRSILKHIPEGRGIRYQKDEEAYLRPKGLSMGVDWQTLKENRFRQTKFQRLDSKTISPTIMTSRGSYYHPKEDRYLTAREAAAIQSFPNDFVFTGSLASQWRQIGNAVPPLLARAIGNALLSMYEKSNPQEHSKKRTLSAEDTKVNIAEVRNRAFIYK
ncbi:MAG: hypothetical protein A2504_15505 [Bdellovibrionales bacterium RIFOXYD12_FULL_39_22]|nr:MAG: hypothetical protein A2385_02935 [Bdellovibrionales bacterium RIFOXYB1_FULL_39_21]OFZ43255.1 MAG: hypothetical protein A2485_12080 [Bdellovibrionales bacterium RIFOXYC12_FULL_39_17]OFZ47993.1 MAG: hypothetical protein A2404_16720 [Bdellovibrionales bacterium RIFOXYC1_FULL_39_130]OFZ75773.1 MAG: hypothetical protein A2560_13220 [Bdellovibrionales bacterium RIFOXYD1_FULL_39_84]OFZ94263.1 MAG: hypothetical protein A2504_15505 [Bdellovibrionales bacterium RIFOXYD12_FULL_39_22]HLE11723.1 DN